MPRPARGAGIVSAGRVAEVFDPWDVPPLQITPGVPLRFNLASTLPAGVRGGGMFAVDPSGTPLPAGITLTQGGELVAEASAAAGQVNGIIFSYTEPE